MARYAPQRALPRARPSRAAAIRPMSARSTLRSATPPRTSFAGPIR
ncbi:hypothetical protein, partial [Mesorhizobium sp.]